MNSGSLDVAKSITQQWWAEFLREQLEYLGAADNTTKTYSCVQPKERLEQSRHNVSVCVCVCVCVRERERERES